MPEIQPKIINISDVNIYDNTTDGDTLGTTIVEASTR